MTRTRDRVARFVASLAPYLVSACATAPPPVVEAPKPPPSPKLVVFGDAPWGVFSSARLEVALPLPDGRGWRIDDHKTPWLSAAHPTSGSNLTVRSWLEDGKADRHRCEEQARIWRALPDPHGADAVQQRSVDAPSGYDTFVSVGVVPEERPGEPVVGFALAFGGHGHRCFVWAFTTKATGPGAAALVGERLALMVDGSLRRVSVENKLTAPTREAPVFERPSF